MGTQCLAVADPADDEDEASSDSSDEDKDEASSDPSDEERPAVLSYWDPCTDTYRNKKTHEIVPDSESDEDEDSSNPSDEDREDSSNSSDEEHTEDLSYWDPCTDSYRSKRTHEPIP